METFEVAGDLAKRLVNNLTEMDLNGQIHGNTITDIAQR